MNRKAFFLLVILISSTTVISHAETQSQLDEFLLKNNNEINILSTKMKQLELEIKESTASKKVKLICEKRRVTRQFIELLDKTYKAKEMIQLSKEDKRFIETRENIKIAKENYKKHIEQEDQILRNEMKMKQEMKAVTIDYVCEINKD